METTRQSISSNGADPTKAAIDREYIRNVLVQFFEHKDKRVSHVLGYESNFGRLNCSQCCPCCLIFLKQMR
jgi:hypothetical protein